MVADRGREDILVKHTCIYEGQANSDGMNGWGRMVLQIGEITQPTCTFGWWQDSSKYGNC
jgi:hypothetical protein